MSPPAPSLVEHQIELSSYMRLLAALRFNHLPSNISNADIRDPTINSDMRHREMIATCMVTGNKGDVVASVLWRKSKELVTIVLARNDPATLDDTRDAKEFLAKLKSSRNLGDLVPFLIKRRGMENFQKCIKKLEDLARSLNRHDVFITAIKKYCERGRIGNLRSELPNRGQNLLALWGSKGVNLSNLNLKQALEDIMHTLIPGSRRALHNNLDVAFTSPEHVKEINLRKIKIPNVLGIALKLAKQSIKNNQVVQSLTIDQLNSKFHSSNEFWIDEKSNTSSFTRDIFIKPKLHAEIQIILHMRKLSDTVKGRRLWPMGDCWRSRLALSYGGIDR
ncbi:hypothetical protein C0995_009362 [Termitomyces sp. Mi166|nr:hypothetical protein C0995_009362 [Termitomyces sp. Mi166\